MAALKGIVWHEKLGTLRPYPPHRPDRRGSREGALSGGARDGLARRVPVQGRPRLGDGPLREGVRGPAGVIGAEYAAASGEPAEVVEAIREHYLPQGPAIRSSTMAGALVSLADRLEALVGDSGGARGDGVAGPYGLRRAGNESCESCSSAGSGSTCWPPPGAWSPVRGAGLGTDRSGIFAHFGRRGWRPRLKTLESRTIRPRRSSRFDPATRRTSSPGPGRSTRCDKPQISRGSW